MKKQAPRRVVIVHGWRGRPDKGWLKSLGTELEKRGIEVINPQLPDRYDPKPAVWVAELARLVGPLDTNTIFVGHSMGCPTILRYLSEYQVKPRGLLTHVARRLLRRREEVQIPAAIFVAGFYELATPALDNFFGPEPDFMKLKSMIKKTFCVYSDNDKIVDPARSKELASKLDSAEILLPGRGHFGNVLLAEVPEVLKLALDVFGLE